MAVTMTAQRRKRKVLSKKGRKPRITKKVGRYLMVNQMGGDKSKAQKFVEGVGEAKRIVWDSAKFVGRQIGKFGSWSKKKLGFRKSPKLPIAEERTEEFINPLFVPVPPQKNSSERKPIPTVDRVRNLSYSSRKYYKGPFGGSRLAKLKNAFTLKRNPNKPSHLSVYQEEKQAALKKAVQHGNKNNSKYFILFGRNSSGRRLINIPKNKNNPQHSDLLKKPFIKSHTNYLTSVKNKITSILPKSVLSENLKIVPSQSGAPQLLISEKDFTNLKNIGLISSQTSLNKRGRVLKGSNEYIRLDSDEIQRIYKYLQPQTFEDYADAFQKLSNRIVGQTNENINLYPDKQTIALSYEYIKKLSENDIKLPESNDYETKKINGQTKIYFNYNPKDLHKLFLEKSIANVKTQVTTQAQQAQQRVQQRAQQQAQQRAPQVTVEPNPYKTS